MKKIITIFVSLIVITIGAYASEVRLAWDASAGTNIIANYKIYYGPASGVYTNTLSAGTGLSVTVSNLIPAGKYYFAATASDTSGLESDYSNEVSTTIPKKPSTPTNLRVTSVTP